VRKRKKIMSQALSQVGMSREEFEALMKELHWTTKFRERRNGQLYVYVAKKIKRHTRETYLCPLSQLEKWSRESIVQHLEEFKARYTDKAVTDKEEGEAA
jgi:hypothetical protein